MILHHLYHQRLRKTYRSLQRETGARLNLVESRSRLRKAIVDGHWASVMRLLEDTVLPIELLVDLHEVICIELCYHNDSRVARTFFQKSTALKELRETRIVEYSLFRLSYGRMPVCSGG